MPGTTPTYALPYQELTDPPDGASLGEDLALAVEAELERIDADVDAAEATLDTVESLGTRTGVRLRRAAAQSVGSGTPGTINWDTEDEDTDGYWSTGSTVTIPTGQGGLYAITYTPLVDALTGAGRCFASVNMTSAVTGTPAIFRAVFDEDEDRAVVSIPGIPLLAGDSFSCDVFHSHGSSRNVTAWLSCYRIGV